MSELVVGSIAGLAANNYVVDIASGSQLTQPGMVLQVVSTAKTDTFSTTSATYADVTGLSASITPRSTNSKVLIIAQISHSTSTADGDSAHFALSGGNTSAYVGDTAGSRVPSVFSTNNGSSNGFEYFAARAMQSNTIVYLDSPATTSSVTYQVQARRGNGTVYVNRSGNDLDLSTYARGASSITVMEIAG